MCITTTFPQQEKDKAYFSAQWEIIFIRSYGEGTMRDQLTYGGSQDF